MKPVHHCPNCQAPVRLIRGIKHGKETLLVYQPSRPRQHVYACKASPWRNKDKP